MKRAAPVKERPILFSAPMVRALLEKRKTQTRRAIPFLLEPSDEFKGHVAVRKRESSRDTFHLPKAELPAFLRSQCPYGGRGDRIWVKETWQALWADADQAPPFGLESREGWAIGYPATDGVQEWHHEDRGLVTRCEPSIFMRRWMSRITLDLTEVRVERLQDISEEDAIAEGAAFHDGRGVGHSGWRHDERDVFGTARDSFCHLWSEINGADSWALNPWVWALSFRQCEGAESSKRSE